MLKKLISLMLVLCMIGGLTVAVSPTAYATDDTVLENQNLEVSLWAYKENAMIGSQGSVSVSLDIQSVSGETIQLSEYKLVIERLTSDSNIIFDDMDLNGELQSGFTTYVDMPYQIPEIVKGGSLKYKVKLVSKTDSNVVLGVSNESAIYPYVINDGVLTYLDDSMGKRYLMTVEMDENMQYWDIPGGGPGNATAVPNENHDYDYYLDSNDPSVVVFTPKTNCVIEKVEVVPPTAGTATKLENQMYGLYEIKLTAPATIKVTGQSAIQAKDWDSVVSNYIRRIRYTDWFTGDEIKNHYFSETAPADDIASVTLSHMDVYKDFEYNDKTYNYEMSYDDFVKEAAKYFVNVPSLKNVNINYIISYDATSDKMIVPSGGIGDSDLITEIVNVEELNQGRYAIHLKVSKEAWSTDHEPDMTNKDEYNECTLVVEDNGENNWRYVSFTGDTSQNPDPGDQSVVEIIEQAPAGSSVNVQMKDTTVVTKDILTAAKGKDVNVVLEMDGYSWTINGKDIDEVKDVDLKVTLDTKAIPDEKVKALAGDKKTKQLTLAYDGEFGFEAELNINVGKDYAKQYGNLYWYNDNKLTFVDAGQVDENGNLSLTFNHASDYVIVFDKEAHDKKAVSSTQTGDTTAMMVYVVPMVLSILGLSLLKKRYANR